MIARQRALPEVSHALPDGWRWGVPGDGRLWHLIGDCTAGTVRALCGAFACELADVLERSAHSTSRSTLQAQPRPNECKACHAAGCRLRHAQEVEKARRVLA